MAGRAIDDSRVGYVFAIIWENMRVSSWCDESRDGELTDKNSPYINKDEQRDVGELLQRKYKREHMVRHTLSKPVQRMKSMARIGRRHNPLVVWLMQNLVHTRMMQTSVDPIYEEVGKDDKERNLYVVVEGKGGV